MNIEPIAYVTGCFPDKFGVPRQPALAPSSRAELVFTQAYQNIDYVRGITKYSHLWLIFGFHHHQNSSDKLKNMNALVRPQRLGGNRKMGVFATRSTYRPNGLGLSVVKLEGINNAPFSLQISSHDLCDGTPIFDIKPYIPFADARFDAHSDFAVNAPETFDVHFSDSALSKLFELEDAYPSLKNLIKEVISQDPRPAYYAKSHVPFDSTVRESNTRIYGVRLYDFDIKFMHYINSAYSVDNNIDNDPNLNTNSFLVIDIVEYVDITTR